MANPLYERLFGRHAGSAAPFLHIPGRAAPLSHGAFVDMAERMAAGLAAAGLKPGDRLAVQLDKSPHMLAVYAACARAGVIFLPLNTAYTAGELDYFIGNSGAALVLVTGARAGEVAPLAASHGARLETLEADGTGSFAALAAGAGAPGPVAERGEDDLAAFLYTSGTTGRSKGAMLTQRNLLSNAEVLARAWHFTAADVLLHALPIFHTHGLFVATNVTLVAGGSMIFLPKYDVDAVLEALPRATAMMGVPTFYTRLLADPRLTREAAGHMRLFVSGSAPLLPETHRHFAGRTGHAILERYGMTETNMNTSNPYEGPRRPGTVGPPLPGVELKIADPATGAALPQGEIGQIEVRGPNVFKGYWQMPEKTAAELRADGFFQTGDLGLVDAEGYVQIVGRMKDLVISGGYNVYPREIEAELDALPGVLESAVIGAPHPDLGEAVVAVLVPEPGAEPDPAEVVGALRARLAGYKLPRAVELLEALPRNAMGKVQKAALRARFADRFAAPAEAATGVVQGDRTP